LKFLFSLEQNMKVFTYDPTTGRRGKQVDDVRIASWCSTGVEYATENGMIEPIDFVSPVGFGSNSEVTVHIDAGITDDKYNDVSYRHETEWRCFCLGEWVAGTGPGEWQWAILPPSSLIIDVESEEWHRGPEPMLDRP